ncbi:Precorrin-6Y C(5,15)-methyltransferase [decarboxylating] [Roseivivax jejudonensis]|uniref:Precorrin-6Y C(5,15)-methyltransferase [decarboxylating] n=1 Tax=Roseivivax jejudonensis TaxID=1529041 RepID=A0A1X6ZLP7_9RHOB|nr:Precorrin-6Y C(5,15)-methyltransferase [decarboxylating] [Roseivivax jejudonensis]
MGLGEDGPDGLSAASRAAIAEADVVMGPERHLSLLPESAAERIVWPVPFSDGLPKLEKLRGRRTVALVSGDPFWYGGGRVIAQRLRAGEWRAMPAPSTFTLAAARMGWAVESTLCVGLHAAPLSRLRPHIARGRRMIVLLRDGEAVFDLCGWLTAAGFSETKVAVLEALGGPNERRTDGRAGTLTGDFQHPVAAALEIAGKGRTMPVVPGLDDALFDHDGQITKRPVRALTLAALAPRAGETLWDIGGGSGSVAIEWLLAHPLTEAISIEADPARARRIRANAAQLGVDRIEVVEGWAPEALGGLPDPDAVFVGGGLCAALLEHLTARLETGTRLVINAVTLESEAVLADWHARRGGDLMRIEVSEAQPLGTRRGWQAAYPVVQWRGQL